MKSKQSARPIRVLAIDEQPIRVAGLRTTLEHQKSMEFVGEAHDAAAALVKAGRVHPDVILFGVGVERQREVETIQGFRERVPEAKILILGDDDQARYVLGLLRAGASGYTSKTSSASQLVRAIKATFEGEVYLSPAIAKALLELEEPDVEQDDGDVAQVLSPRESQVLSLIARGLTNRQIAERLGISARTVETHRERIMRKLDIHTVAGLTRYAIQRGVIDIEERSSD